MPKRTNEEREACGLSALQLYLGLDESEGGFCVEETATDLLTDLAHFLGRDVFISLTSRARRHVEQPEALARVEQGDDKGTAWPERAGGCRGLEAACPSPQPAPRG